jgi:hypothetical protein
MCFVIAYIIIMGIHTISSVYGTTICATDMTHIFSGPYLRTNAVMTGVERKDLSIFNRFYSNFKEAYFWSSNKLDSNPGKAWKLALELSRAKVYYGITSKINGLSVRCIKNSEVMKVGGIKYNTIKIGTQIWTAENMRHGINSVENGIYSYYDDLNNDKLYGKSYAWSAAMRGATAEGSQGICAKNWLIPTDEDWKQLEGLSRIRVQFIRGLQIGLFKIAEEPIKNTQILPLNTRHDCIKPTGTSFFELCALIGATPCHIQI